MLGVVIKKGPQNWQILQQRNGVSEVDLSGEIYLPEEKWSNDLHVAIHVYQEQTGMDVISPIYLKVSGKEWKTNFSIPAGGMYTIATLLRYGERESYRGDRIFHVGVGDLYLIAGQSNASGTSKDSMEDPVTMNVHMLRLNGEWDLATHPLHDSTGALRADIYNECGFHSPWIAFARQVSEAVGYPIGLIPAAKGGTPLDYWDRTADGRLFEAMLQLVTPLENRIKGILWYQGCNDSYNAENANSYLERFSKVCRDFRRCFHDEIPILTVQLNKSTCQPYQAPRYWATVREAQRQAAKQIPKVYVVPSVDLPVCDTIHNSAHSNLVIARRMACVALKHVYGKTVVAEFPDVSGAKLVAPDTVRVSFDNVFDAITTDYCDVSQLMIQVEDENGTADVVDFHYNADHTMDFVFERAICGEALIGCTGFTALGTMPYDVATRFPALAFCDVEVQR